MWSSPKIIPPCRLISDDSCIQEIVERVAKHVSRKREVVQFHWGGGTPTYLTPPQMEQLFNFARERFTFARDAEIGIEVRITRVTSRTSARTLRRLGFNRLSLGIQDFHPEVQEAIHRVQPYEATRDMISYARELGFDSINVDLIYGLPYQNAERFRTTVSQVLTMAPDRVAMFSYAHVPWLRKQQGAFQTHLPEGIEKFRIFCAGLQTFSGRRIFVHRHGSFREAPAMNSPSPNKAALCTGIFRATPQKPARICTVWASARLAQSAAHTDKTKRK